MMTWISDSVELLTCSFVLLATHYIFTILYSTLALIINTVNAVNRYNDATVLGLFHAISRDNTQASNTVTLILQTTVLKITHTIFLFTTPFPLAFYELEYCDDENKHIELVRQDLPEKITPICEDFAKKRDC